MKKKLATSLAKYRGKSVIAAWPALPSPLVRSSPSLTRRSSDPNRSSRQRGDVPHPSPESPSFAYFITSAGHVLNVPHDKEEKRN